MKEKHAEILELVEQIVNTQFPNIENTDLNSRPILYQPPIFGAFSLILLEQTKKELEQNCTDHLNLLVQMLDTLVPQLQNNQVARYYQDEHYNNYLNYYNHCKPEYRSLLIPPQDLGQKLIEIQQGVVNAYRELKKILSPSEKMTNSQQYGGLYYRRRNNDDVEELRRKPAKSQLTEEIDPMEEDTTYSSPSPNQS
ncbi:Uncharacterised protein [Legionella busanensis]|uniref:Uncharacterized protein n=1 Tax=Legionella busanensis TaxID=190655 RepID=A0A378JH78_9GAMM|nr:hypothetical protein [Legionella busanensis]STX50656.1 Uncharacterised protein [Legionella busanensis]